MFGYRRTDRRNIFYNSSVLSAWRTQRVFTIRAVGQFVFYCLIDVNRDSSPDPGMPILAVWLSVSLSNRRLAVDRLHGRRRRQGSWTFRCLSFGFEISLEPGVFLFQVFDSFLLFFVFLLLFVKRSLQTLVFSFQAFFVPLQMVDLFSLSFKKSGKTLSACSSEGESMLASYGMKTRSLDTHPMYYGLFARICSAKSHLPG
jgi:hypothetical protein